eukprot:4124300-Pleurochrysis_carterae.AAC.1
MTQQICWDHGVWCKGARLNRFAWKRAGVGWRPGGETIDVSTLIMKSRVIHTFAFVYIPHLPRAAVAPTVQLAS